jgi:hypothetical protein
MKNTFSNINVMFFAIFVGFGVSAHADVSVNSFSKLQIEKPSPEALILIAEFTKLYNFVSTAKEDGRIDDFMKYKNMNGYEILWDLMTDGSEFDSIAIYRQGSENPSHPSEREFAVAYYRSTQIIEGRNVIRRFVGPTVADWRNDTIDFETGEYLGSQGRPDPLVTKGDQAILDEWGIRIW